jgi:putative DNA primase/helicase
MDSDISFHLTDTGNAKRFQSYYDGKVVYLSEQGKFIQWNASDGWCVADKYKLAKEVVKDMYEDAADWEDDNQRRHLAEHALKTESAQYQRNMLELAASYMSISIDQFDSNPTLINCRNGIVNLTDKTFFRHSPEHLHFNITNVNYNSDAQCPRWLRFLNEIFDDDENLIDYMQVALGYSMLGLTREHLLFLCYGSGRNGKTTLLETVHDILGDYADKAVFETSGARNVRLPHQRSPSARVRRGHSNRTRAAVLRLVCLLCGLALVDAFAQG